MDLDLTLSDEEQDLSSDSPAFIEYLEGPVSSGDVNKDRYFPISRHLLSIQVGQQHTYRAGLDNQRRTRLHESTIYFQITRYDEESSRNVDEIVTDANAPIYLMVPRSMVKTLERVAGKTMPTLYDFIDGLHRLMIRLANRYSEFTPYQYKVPENVGFDEFVFNFFFNFTNYWPRIGVKGSFAIYANDASTRVLQLDVETDLDFSAANLIIDLFENIFMHVEVDEDDDDDDRDNRNKTWALFQWKLGNLFSFGDLPLNWQPRFHSEFVTEETFREFEIARLWSGSYSASVRMQIGHNDPKTWMALSDIPGDSFVNFLPTDVLHQLVARGVLREMRNLYTPSLFVEAFARTRAYGLMIEIGRSHRVKFRPVDFTPTRVSNFSLVIQRHESMAPEHVSASVKFDYFMDGGTTGRLLRFRTIMNKDLPLPVASLHNILFLVSKNWKVWSGDAFIPDAWR